MKKTIIICVSFTIFSFLCCLICGLNLFPVPAEVLKSDAGGYRFAETMRLFFRLFPSIVASGYTIGLAVAFGSDQDGSRIRFSTSMFKRFRKIMIFCLVSIFLFTFGTEVFVPMFNGKIVNYREKQSSASEYYNLAQNLYDQGEYSLSFIYSKKAYEINNEDPDISRLMKKSELEAEKKNIEEKKVPVVRGITKTKPALRLQSRITVQEPYTVLNLLKAARDCSKAEDWFGAHYNATEALKAASDNDANIFELKQIAANAWNKLNQSPDYLQSEANKIFRKKFEGYTALVNGNFLKAYYVFKTLSLTSKALSLDPDVVLYHQIAKDLVENTYFFIDETYNLKSFETALNVNFVLHRKDGSKYVIFIKGITPIVDSTHSVEYLRDLTVFEIDEKGNCVKAFYDNYSKLTSISANNFDKETKLFLGIDEDIEYVPFIMLKSVDRKNEGVVNSPEIAGNLCSELPDDCFILPMEFDDFETIQEASKGPENMSMSSLFGFTGDADKFGFSHEIFAQTMMDRLLYPFFVLVIMILLASFAWECRLKEGQNFKFKWIVMFPFLGIIFYLIYRASLVLYKLINFALLGIVDFRMALILGMVIQLLLIFGVSILLLSRKNNDM